MCQPSLSPFFHRYTPFNTPSETRMTVKGVKISERHNIVCDERACRLFLQNLSAQSSGIYRCEIAGEAPTFQVVQNQANMTVLGELQMVPNAITTCSIISASENVMKFFLSTPET